MERRAFIGVSGRALMLATITGGTMSLEGCDALTQLEQWIPDGIFVLDGVVTILNPPAGSVLALATAAIPKLWLAIDDAITEYKSTNPPPQGSLQKVVTGLQDLSDQLTDVLDALPVSIPAVDILAIEAGLKLVIATLNFFAQKHATTPTPAPAAAARAAKLAKHGALPAPAMNKKDFDAKWNALGIKKADGSLLTIQ